MPFKAVNKIDGGHGNAGLLNKLDLCIEHALVIAIQSQNESALDLHAMLLDRSNRVEDEILLVLAGVLRLLGLEQGLRVGRLDADEHGIEAGLDHGVHQRVH